jgi:integrase
VAWLRSSDDDFVFPGRKPGRPLGQHVMKTLMRAMGYNGVATAHGFRSTFKDWATEQTDFRTEAIELALAHAVGNKVEEAYRRGELLEKRRLLIKAWADFCLGLTPLSASNVVPFPKPSTGARTTQQLAFEFP